MINPLISEEEIAKKVREIASLVDRDFANKNLVIICVLKGAIVFVSDLIRCITIPFTLEFIEAQSYGMGGMKRGSLQIQGVDRLDLQGKDVLIVDDIFDSGNTLHTIALQIKQEGPASVSSLVLLNKKVSISRPIEPEYVCFDIEDHFVIGYGLDYKENYRGLKGIHTIVE